MVSYNYNFFIRYAKNATRTSPLIRVGNKSMAANYIHTLNTVNIVAVLKDLLDDY